MVQKSGLFDTARLFSENFKEFFDCGNKVFMKMLLDLTPYYFTYSFFNTSLSTICDVIPTVALKVDEDFKIRKKGLSWEDSFKYVW